MKALKVLGIALTVIVLIIGAVAAYVAFTFDAARLKQEAARVVLEKTGRTLTIDGDLALSFWPSLGVKAGKAALSEPKGGERFAAFDSAQVAVRLLPLLSKRIVVDRIELDGLDLLLIRDHDGHLNIDDLLGGKKSDAEAVATPTPEFSISGIRIANARIEWRDLRAGSSVTIADLDLSTGRAHSDRNGFGIQDVILATRGKLAADNFELTLEVPSAERKGEQIAAEEIGLKASLKGAARDIAANLTLRNIHGTMQALTVNGFAADIDARLGDKSLKGKLKSPVTLDPVRSVVLLNAIDGELALDMPDLPTHPLKLPLTGQVKAEYAKPAVAAYLATQFDESHVDARFNLVGGKPPYVGLDLDIDKLNVDKYIPPSKQDKAKDDKIDFSALKTLNAKGNLRIGELQVKKLKAKNVRVSFRATGGRVDISPHAADLYGGHLNGAMSLDAAANRVALKQSLVGIDIQPLLKDLADKDVIEGHGDVALDIATQGDTVAAMKKSLAGSAHAVLRDGAIKGINLAQTLRTAKAKLGGGVGGGTGDSITQSASSVDKTDFSELSASFTLAKGIAHNDDLAAKSPFLRLGGSGDIDIGDSRLDYLLKASVVSTAAGQGGKELDALKGLTVPVRVSGPFEKPAFKLELASLVTDTTKLRIEEKKQQAKQKLQENLKGQLKGLFGK